jgi:hypothetical protein
MVEDVVCHPFSLPDACSLVEVPMDAKINAALAILVFSLRQGRKAARHVRANIALVIFGHAIEFIRSKGEANVIGPIKATDRFEERALPNPAWPEG